MMRIRPAIFLFLILLKFQCIGQIRIPASIDGTGSADVTQALNSFLESVPDDKTLVFPLNKVYRVEGILRIKNKKNVTIQGNGSSIIAETIGEHIMIPDDKPRHNWPRSREHLRIESSNNIRITNLSIRGPHINGGISLKAYVRNLEAQHGINIYNSKNVVLDSLRITNIYGDCIYIGDGKGEMSSDSITVRNSFLGFTGRQGIAITFANHVSIENCEFSEIRRAHIDLENGMARASIRDVVIKNNIFRKSRLHWIAAAGKGNITDIHILHNRIIDKEPSVVLGNPKYSNFGPFYFINNRSNKPVGNPQGAAWKIINVKGFYASDNNIALASKRKMHLVGERNSSDIRLENNVVPGAVGELKTY